MIILTRNNNKCKDQLNVVYLTWDNLWYIIAWDILIYVTLVMQRLSLSHGIIYFIIQIL